MKDFEMDDIDLEMDIREFNQLLEADEQLFGAARELGFEIKEVVKLGVDEFRLLIDDGTRSAWIDITPHEFLWFAGFHRRAQEHGFEPNAVTRGTWIDLTLEMMRSIRLPESGSTH